MEGSDPIMGRIITGVEEVGGEEGSRERIFINEHTHT